MLIIANIKSGNDLQETDFLEWCVSNTKSIDLQRIDSHNVYRFQSYMQDMYEMKKWIKDNGHGLYSFKVTYNYE